MARFDHHGEDGFRFGLVFDYRHLHARDHDVARLKFRDLHGALGHRQGVPVQQVAPLGIPQQFYQRGPVARSPCEQRGQLLRPGAIIHGRGRAARAL